MLLQLCPETDEEALRQHKYNVLGGEGIIAPAMDHEACKGLHTFQHPESEPVAATSEIPVAQHIVHQSFGKVPCLFLRPFRRGVPIGAPVHTEIPFHQGHHGVEGTDVPDGPQMALKCSGLEFLQIGTDGNSKV